MTTFDQFQKESKATAIYPKEKALEYVILGLASEVGEVCGKVKKIIRDSGGKLSQEQRVAIIEEGGDCLWYLAQLFTELNWSLGDAARANLKKLQSRQVRGVIGGSGDTR